MRLSVLLTVAAGCVIFSAPLSSQAPPGPLVANRPAPAASTDAKTLSVRVVAYSIDAKLDPTKHTIAATETLTYKNLTGKPQQTFPFHMYLNAFQPQSTFMTEVRRTCFHARRLDPDAVSLPGLVLYGRVIVVP